MTKYFLFALLIIIHPNKLSAQVPDSSYPGGVVVIEVEKTSSTIPVIRYGTKEPALIQRNGKWNILIGIGLDQQPGEYIVYYRNQSSDETAQFHRFEVGHNTTEVIQRDGGANHKKIPSFRSLSDLEFQNTTPPILPFDFPSASTWDSNFGAHLISTDGQMLGKQNYTYSMVNSGAILTAPQNGILSRVISTGETKSLVIDHGGGIYSLFHGLGEVSVQLGYGLAKGETIGVAPRLKGTNVAGRKNSQNDGKELVYWQVLMNGEFVNPALLNRLFAQ